MDMRHLNPFVRSTCNTFETMCHTAVKVGKPQLNSGDDPPADVSGIIGFSGDAVGCVVLHFSFEVAAKIATAFAGTEINQDHPDFADAIGELANLVAGGAKSQFEALKISNSLPNVVVGRSHSVAKSKSAPRLRVPVETDLGPFCLEVGMLVNRQSQGSVKPALAGVPS